MNRRTLITITGLAAIFATGCTVDKEGDAKWEDPFFRSPQTESHVTRIYKTATNVGALKDGTIQAMHFDGNELNDLGQTKIDAMIEAHKPGTSLNVYLDLPKNDPTAEARQETLNNALASAGVPTSEIVVALGTNPNSTSDSAYVIGNDGKSSGGSTSSSGSSADSSGNIAN
ncbi:MAG TPA: hypothetical protein PK402_08350 [Tepidisphaeraceae bacterium]|nr:hypothetical protein [Tepidisphaeraceae bacterium]